MRRYEHERRLSRYPKRSANLNSVELVAHWSGEEWIHVEELWNKEPRLSVDVCSLYMPYDRPRIRRKRLAADKCGLSKTGINGVLWKTFF